MQSRMLLELNQSRRTGSVLQEHGGPEIQVLPHSKFPLQKKAFFLGCLLIDPGFDDQRLVSVVVVVVVRKGGRQICLKVLINQLGKCQSPSGRDETRSPVWLPLRGPLHLLYLYISCLGFTSSLAWHPPHSLIYYCLSLLSFLHYA